MNGGKNARHPDGLIFAYDGYIERRNASTYSYCEGSEASIYNINGLLYFKALKLAEQGYKDNANILFQAAKKIKAICESEHSPNQAPVGDREKRRQITEILKKIKNNPNLQSNREIKEFILDSLFQIGQIDRSPLERTTGTYWKYKNLSVFAYTAPKPRHDQALSDWNRQIESPALCTYYINNVKLSDLREGKPFLDNEDLKTFFKEHLFPLDNIEKQELLAEQACYHFHQAGFPHATNFCVNNTNKNPIKASEPKVRIDFKVTEKGLIIREENIYKALVDDKTGEKDEVSDSAKYHAKTTTTSLITPKGISLLDLKVDCPSRKASIIFDKRSLLDKLYQYFINITAEWMTFNFKGKNEMLENISEAQTVIRF